MGKPQIRGSIPEVPQKPINVQFRENMLNIDETDRKIIDALISNGRASSADIARAIGNISERSVRYRIDRLVENDVVQIGAIPNPLKLGLSVTANVYIEVEPGSVYDVARKLAEFEMVCYVACSTGESDISVQIYAKNNMELYNFVADVIGKIPGVRRTTTAIIPVIIKDIFSWHIPSTVCCDDQKEMEAGGITG